MPRLIRLAPVLQLPAPVAVCGVLIRIRAAGAAVRARVRHRTLSRFAPDQRHPAGRRSTRFPEDHGHARRPLNALYFAVFDLWAPVWKRLTPEASHKVKKGNYERIFDEGRKQVRAWEKANVT